MPDVPWVHTDDPPSAKYGAKCGHIRIQENTFRY